MKKIHLIALGLLAGIILALGWPMRGIPVLLFFGFVPLLFVDDYLLKHRQDFSRYSIFFILFPGFLLWNLLVGYWVINSTITGGIVALVFNTFLMATTFTVYHIARRQIYTPNKGQFLLIFIWITFEYFHLNWQISFPWLNLGNGFAMWNKWIQWYEFTGALGGSFWILLINLLSYKLLVKYKETRKVNRPFLVHFSGIVLLIIVPLFISLFIYSNYEEKENPVDIVIVQPNLDPYSEQYGLAPRTVMNRIFDLADQKMDQDVDLVLCPESANQENMFEDRLESYVSNRMIRNYINQKHPNTGFIIGASTFKFVSGEDTLARPARKFRNRPGYYFAYNAAMYFNAYEPVQLYHKSKLTTGVETMPSARILRPLEKLAIDLGGTVGTLAIDDERNSFTVKDSLKLATIICYESVYGEFTSGFVRNGAQAIFVITNDGWWGNTPGYKQHFSMSKMRAIETRRSVARSANTGISAFINQRGDVVQQTNYWVKDVIRGKINLNDKLTFYTQNGNYIARISVLISALFLLISISMGALKKRKSI